MRLGWTFALLVALAMLCGCSTSSTYTRINAFELEVPSAPDMHGVNGYMNPGESNWRISGDVNIHKEEGLHRGGYGVNSTSCKLGSCDRIHLPQEKVHDNFVRKNMDYFSGDIEYLTKSGSSRDAIDQNAGGMFSFGIAYRQGALIHAGFGINTRYFEVGATLGLWGQYRHLTYRATKYSCYRDVFPANFYAYQDDEDKEIYEEHYTDYDDATTIVGTYGGYLSAYYGPMFLTFSASIYTPVMTLTTSDSYYGFRNMEEDMPKVITEYFTFGYRISKMVEVHAGASNMLGEFEGWHWGATGGVSLYL